MSRCKALPPRIKPISLDTAKAPPVTFVPLYSSKEWLGLMATIRKQRGNRCEHCDRVGVRLVGDHIVELKDGGAPLDAANVALLCWSCHTTKTNKARAARISKPLTGG